MKTISILGCGWFGLPLGIALRKNGSTVLGSTTTHSRLQLIAEHGIEPFLIDLSGVGRSLDFFNSEALVICVPPRIKQQGEDQYLAQMQQARVWAEEGRVSHVVFISSTSVYPDLNKVVTESDVETNSILARAESIFSSSEKFLTSIIRFAGLVGPGRNPGRFLSGKTVSGESVPVNIIHLDDCVAITEEVLRTGAAGAWSACADIHPEKKEFYFQAALTGGFPLPVFVAPGTQHYKIVDSSLLKQTFKYTFIHPDPMKMRY